MIKMLRSVASKTAKKLIRQRHDIFVSCSATVLHGAAVMCLRCASIDVAYTRRRRLCNEPAKCHCDRHWNAILSEFAIYQSYGAVCQAVVSRSLLRGFVLSSVRQLHLSASTVAGQLRASMVSLVRVT